MSAAVEQRTEAWFSARLGKVTASRVADVVARTQSGYSTSREKYAVELAVERITGQRVERAQNAAMAWGVEQEAPGRGAYEIAAGVFVAETGLVLHPRIPSAGASPDGLVGSDGLIEIKCPDSSTHIRTISTRRIDPRYMTQMQWQMACTERDWCDFVSYDPRLPAGLTLYVQRVPRDPKLIDTLEQEVVKFLWEVDEMVARLEALRASA